MILTTEHPRWDEFCGRLAAELQRRGGGEHEKPDFLYMLKGCKSGRDKSAAEQVLREMDSVGVDIPKSLAYFEEHGGYCDCEILLNVDAAAQEGNEP